MTQEQIKSFIDTNIRYKGWEFFVGDKNGAMYLQVRFDAPDHSNIERIERQHCRKFQLSEWMTPTEIVHTCWLAVQRAEMHEAAELFTYKGCDIFNTHIAVDGLVDVCRANKYEHRGDL